MTQANNEGSGASSTEVDELADKLQGRVVISLKGKEWEEAGQNLEFAILLRRASGKGFKKKLLVELLSGVWKVNKQPTFQKVENNILLVNFQTEKDGDMVLEGGPWSFEGEVLILQKWEEGMTAEDFNNTKINIFVQVYGLPFELRKDEGTRSVVEQIGKIKEHKSNGSLRESAYGKEYMRYRIEVDINTPLLDGVFLERRGRKPTWVYLKYEKLPTICYLCGVLNHGTRNCMHYHKDKEKDMKYGAWIKAEERAENIQAWTESTEPARVFGSQPESMVRGVIGNQSDPATHIPMMVDFDGQGVESTQEARAFAEYDQRTLLDLGKRPKEQERTKVALSRELDICKFGKGAPNTGDGLGVVGRLNSKDQMIDLGQGSVKVGVGPSSTIVFKRKIGRRKRGSEDCWGQN